MQDFYSDKKKHYIAVDCIIFGFDDDQLNLLLIRRNFEPCKGQWSLMGGFLNDQESLDEAADRILFQLTGLEDIYLEQLYTYGKVQRDSAARVISVAYYALIRTDKFEKKQNGDYEARWFPVDDCPDLVFDHNTMVSKALKRLRRKSLIEPLGFELLPSKFTLPQLQSLYETIHGRELDKRNFRKKILSLGVIKQLDEKEKASSKRGAWYYSFDKETYDYLLGTGTHFEL